MTFHFAWVAPTETTFAVAHQREDEEVFAFRMEHTEGDFPMLSIEIRNPRRQFLGEGADLWMWLAEDGTPLFFGRLVAIPENLHDDRPAELCRAPDWLRRDQAGARRDAQGRALLGPGLDPRRADR